MFHTGGKTAQEEQCDKSIKLSKVVDNIINIVSFEQKYFILKWISI